MGSLPYLNSSPNDALYEDAVDMGAGSRDSGEELIEGPACARYLNGSPNDALYEDAVDTGVRAELALGNCGPQTAGFFHLHRDSVDWVFVDNPVFHRPGVPVLLSATWALSMSACCLSVPEVQHSERGCTYRQPV